MTDRQLKVLYIDYNMFGKAAIISSFEELGCKVLVDDCPLYLGEDTEETRIQLTKRISDLEDGIVFTSNYYPVISDICERFGIKYVSWTYDSPRVALYDRSISNVCNYAFVFDSNEYRRLKKQGIDRVFYMPLGVDVESINRIEVNDEDRIKFGADVSLVASLYNEEHNLYDRLRGRIDEYSGGYLDAVIEAQRHIYGGCILEESLEDEIIDNMYAAMPYESEYGSYADLKYIYANYFLARKTATYQRMDFIKAVSDRFLMKVYSPGNLQSIPKVKHMGTVDYDTDMNKVFQMSKINLNITLPSIRSGIPLRALDIMGAGGFLLTDYRPDFEGLFEAGVDYVYYTSIDDAISKIEYYLLNEDERIEIAENGRRKIEMGFKYVDRIQDMLDIVL